jgi:hypothetical protein
MTEVVGRSGGVSAVPVLPALATHLPLGKAARSYCPCELRGAVARDHCRQRMRMRHTCDGATMKGGGHGGPSARQGWRSAHTHPLTCGQ